MNVAGRAAEGGILKRALAFFRTAEPKVGSAAIPRTLRRELRDTGAPGREALATLDKYGSNVVFRDGGGAMHDFKSNTIFIDRNSSIPQSVSIVHEATHVRWEREGRRADITRLGRADYVNRMVGEETDSAVNQIRATMALQRGGMKIPDDPLQGHYVSGYRNAVQHAATLAHNEGRTLTAAEREYAGDLGGRGAVYAGFHNGDVRGSVTNTPYPEYYGSGWDNYQAWLRSHGQHP